MPQRHKKTQVVAVIAVAVLMMFASVGVTLYVSGKLPGFSPEHLDEGYKNITLTDAYLVCEKRARDQFDERLKSLEMDDHSSRYDANTRRYKIFISVELYEGSGRGAAYENYYANCLVRSDNGRISIFDYAKDRVSHGAPDTSNPFFPGG